MKLILKLFHIKKFGNINTKLKFEALFDLLIYSDDIEVFTFFFGIFCF